MAKLNIIKDYKRKASNIPEFVALSFFSGAMGLDLGLKRVKIDPILACESDNSCRHTITLNHTEIALIGDIWGYTVHEIYEYANLPKNYPVDLIVGGPPCQSFSTAGKQEGFNDPRGNTFLRFIEIVGEILPRYVVIENVRGLLSASYPINNKDVKGGALYTVLTKLRLLGYQVSFNLYNSANFGVSQARERLVLIAHLGEDKVPYLNPTHSDDPSHGLPKWKTLRDAFDLLPPDTVHTHTNFTPKRLEYYKLLSAGQNWRDLPEHLHKKALGNSYGANGGKTGIYRRLSLDKPSPTLLTSPTMFATSLGHPEEDRPLSVEEYAVIQGFPLDYTFCGSIADKYKQIGNAVPIKLAEAIGRAILDHSAGFIRPSSASLFPYSRYKDTDDVAWERNLLCRIDK